MRNRRGQSAVEFTMLITIILGVLIAMQVYFKRGLQGRWKSSVDDVGEQYDPAYTNGYVMSRLFQSTRTALTTVPDGVSGIWTMRADQSNSDETKDSSITILTAP